MDDIKLKSAVFSTPNSSKLAQILLQLKEMSDVNVSTDNINTTPIGSTLAQILQEIGVVNDSSGVLYENGNDNVRNFIV